MIPLLALATVLAMQQPQPPAASAEDAAKEVIHLRNIRQVTFGFSRAGEGYFRPDGQAIIFQAVPRPRESVFHTPAPNEEDYQIYTADLTPDAQPRMVSTGKGACTCAFYHPDGQSILFGSTHLDASPSGPKTAPYSRTERYRWDFPRGMDIFHARPAGSPLVRLTDTPD